VRVLLLHDRYRLAGGEDTVVSAEMALLRSRGQAVRLYQVSNCDIDLSVSRARAAARAIYSVRAKRDVSRELADFAPDIVHVHNFFPLLSPSVHFASRRAGAAIVQTLHNFRLLCPNGLLFRHGHPCQDCLGRSVPWPSVLHGCYRESRLATAAVGAMLTAHRALGTWSRMVDVCIAPSDFVREKFVGAGFAPERVAVKPHFLAGDSVPGDGRGGYALFVGRISEEKGIETLLGAWERLHGLIPLKIVGDGPLLRAMRATARASRDCEWLGQRPGDEVRRLMQGASILVVPSRWYETFGMVIIEAFAAGLPVVAPRHGATAELVDSGRTGLHFTAGDASDLAAAVKWLVSHPGHLAAMRSRARAEFEEKYGDDRNYALLMGIYARALEVARSRGARGVKLREEDRPWAP